MAAGVDMGPGQRLSGGGGAVGVAVGPVVGLEVTVPVGREVPVAVGCNVGDG